MGGLFGKPKADPSVAAANKASMRAAKRQERNINQQQVQEQMALGERRRIQAARVAGNMANGGPRGVQDTLG